MLTRSTRLKLVAFAVVGVIALSYGLIDLLRVQRVVRPQHVVSAVFADPQGLYPMADVDQLGVNVGSVREVKPGPGSASTVVMELDRGARIPEDVSARVSSKSAIGEQSVQLTPRSTGGSTLGDGDTIPLERTTSPPDLGKLIGNLDSLVRSVPLKDLRTTLKEGSLAMQDLPSNLGRVLESSDDLSASAVRNADDLVSLIRSAQTVLDTQVDLGGRTTAYAASLAGLTTELRELDPTFDKVFVRGVATGQQVTGLLEDNQAALPVLLNDLVSLTSLGDHHLAGIRKALVVFPWTVEYNAQALRYCDKIDARTGDPVEETCHYDEDGKPIWSAHVADVLKARGAAPYSTCTRGYETTKRYLANGQPADGVGPRQAEDAQPNFKAGCSVSATDDFTPNVRGFQNLPGRKFASNRTAPTWGLALMNPESGVVVTPDGLPLQLTSKVAPMPDDGSADLGWLMTQNLTG